jgi:ATP-binding cassette subfamily B (MDR/TAP) protein 1
MDAYQLKFQKEKEEKQHAKAQKAPVIRVLRQMRPEWTFIAAGVAGAAMYGAVFPTYAYFLANVITTIVSADSDLNPGPLAGVNLYAFIFVMLGIVCFFGNCGQMMGFEIAGERYTRRLRGLLFRKYMDQEVGYFDQDEHTTGALTTKLAVDAKNVTEMITKVWGEILQVCITAIVGKFFKKLLFFFDSKLASIRSHHCICLLLATISCCALCRPLYFYGNRLRILCRKQLCRRYKKGQRTMWRSGR